MREIGNILASAFLSAIGQLAGLSLIPSVPGYARDMAGSILDLVLIELSRLEDTALVIETVFREAGEGIHGHFFLLPDPQTLEATLRAAERAGAAGGRGVSRTVVGIADLRTARPRRGARRARPGLLRRRGHPRPRCAGAGRSRTSCCRSQGDGRRREGENMNKYADVAVAEAVRSLEDIGCRRADMEAKIAGGASIFDLGRGTECGDIGAPQRRGGRARPGAERVRLLASDVGGREGRTVEFSPDSGELAVKTVRGLRRSI